MNMGFLISEEDYRWPNRKIFFHVDPNLLSNTSAAQTVRQAIDLWNNRALIELVELDAQEIVEYHRPPVRDHLKFQLALTQCQSHVGRQGGEQIIECGLTAAGFGIGSVLHEIG